MEENNASTVYWVHQGHNLRKWRENHGIEIDAFARKMDMEVKEIDRLEMSQMIPDKLLKKILSLFCVPLEELKEREEPFPSSYTSTTHTTFTNNGSVSGVYTFNGPGWTNANISNSPTIHPVKQICEMYERMLERSTDKIQTLEKQITEMQTELTSLLKK